MLFDMLFVIFCFEKITLHINFVSKKNKERNMFHSLIFIVAQLSIYEKEINRFSPSIAIKLAIVPVGTNRPLSFPNKFAEYSSSSRTVGSSPYTSSPVLAVKASSNIIRVGDVTVSLLKSTMDTIDLAERYLLLFEAFRCITIVLSLLLIFELLLVSDLLEFVAALRRIVERVNSKVLFSMKWGAILPFFSSRKEEKYKY